MVNKLERNPFREGTAAHIFCEIAGVDWETGMSRIVKNNEFPSGMELTNGGSWCRNDGALGKFFVINRIKKKGRIVAVQLCGYRKINSYQQIPIEVREKFKESRCVFLDVGLPNDKAIDHKDGRKDDPSLSSDDYQPVHYIVNTIKREHCKKCKETGLRYDARRLGFSVPQTLGPEEYCSCLGCYWYDPIDFRKRISKDFRKEK